ncbi:MAG: putative Fe-S cluster assembly protein SufT [Thermoanaerobaculia bacterium]|nr:putative Fe-S cluster assembly protein SufT [Thermoanaerobaculia bacterium]
MTPQTPTAHSLSRDCAAIRIPSGEPVNLPAGTPVTLTQSLGGTFTVQAPSLGGLFRIAGSDADALGLEVPAGAGPAASPGRPAAAGHSGPVNETAVWDRLRTVYDPEIPVNIVDLGLVYDLRILPASAAGERVEVKMTLTAPGCGMGGAIAADAQSKIAAVPGVAEAEVQVVWDPPWSAEMMTPEGKKILGIA